MRVLLRLYDNEEFVWKEAEYKKEGFYVDGKRVKEINVVATDDCDLSGYIYCNSCGERIKDEPGAFEQHCAEVEAKKDCGTCGYLRIGRIDDNYNRTFHRNENGLYEVTETYNNASLTCTKNYRRCDIESEEAVAGCIFMQCRDNGTRTSDIVFERKPNAFDTVITVDVLQEKKLKFDRKTDNYRTMGIEGKNYFLYDMKARGTIKACVNSIGIVECFLVTTAGCTKYMFYSEKYNQMFYESNGKYFEGRPYEMTERKYQELFKKVKELYESAKEATNE